MEDDILDILPQILKFYSSDQFSSCFILAVNEFIMIIREDVIEYEL